VERKLKIKIMIIRLVKPYSIGDNVKPVGREMEVTPELGKELIDGGIAENAEVAIPKEKKQLKNK
jgi:hypothetical protein